MKAASPVTSPPYRDGDGKIEREQYMLALAFNKTTHKLFRSLKLQEVLDIILDNIGKFVPHDSANLMLMFNGVARIVACRGYEDAEVVRRIKSQKRVVQEVLNLTTMMETGQPIVLPDTQNSPNWVVTKNSANIRSYISAPIRRSGRTIGFINLNSSIPGLYNDDHASRLLIFSEHASIAIENAILYENAQKEINERIKAEQALQETLNELETRVQQRTSQLLEINAQLTQELRLRNQAEVALHEERERLALRVEERTAELSSANAELAKTARMKDGFLASMSHELRTPLNAILNISESLQEGVYGEVSEAQARSVRTIEESGRHLLALINDVLDISKIGAGKFELMYDVVSVKALVDGSVALVENAARNKQIKIETSIDASAKTLWGDQRRLKQVLVNLLSNAVKFTPPGGAIGVTVRTDAQKGHIKFITWDTGIGIPEDSIKLLFKPFVQLDNGLARQFEGSGLGLALAYHIVELHGGGIYVQSDMGKGSQFVVTLNWKESAGFDPPLDALHSDALQCATAEVPFADAITLVGRYLNEMGIETQYEWLLKGTKPLNNSFPSNEVLVVDIHLLFSRNSISLSLQELGGRYFWPIIVVAPHQDMAQIEPDSLPSNIGVLSPPFDRKDLRTLIRSISPDGTASLIRRATIYRERELSLPSSQPMILIADDNETSRQVYYDYLTIKGFRVALACDGAEVIERARECQPELILMDIQMPGIDGLEAISRIRADENVRHIPIIALTALAMPSDRTLCLNVGANGYLSKPIGLEELVAAIQQQLNQ
ncbi:MAG TPA: response regulator [Levilinea sp.]|nr:response regulator [Levilinea sp.]